MLWPPFASATPPVAPARCSWPPPSVFATCEMPLGGPILKTKKPLACCWSKTFLWGYDINLTATHMAASTLGMLSPTTRFHRMNIHRALLGVFEGDPYSGLSRTSSHGQARLAAWPSADTASGGRRGNIWVNLPLRWIW